MKGVRRSPTGVLAMLVVVMLALGVWLINGGDPGSPTALPDGQQTIPSGMGAVELTDLPSEAARTVALIEAGGPYPYDADDGVFGNYEGLLPDRSRGFYREHTVETPGSTDRGARRIIAAQDGVLYWTADHYASFKVIRR